MSIDYSTFPDTVWQKTEGHWQPPKFFLFIGTVSAKQLINALFVDGCLFVMVPNSRINSWESWFIFNLRKINIDQYCRIGLQIME
jgi:hypothetical protein